MYDALLLGVRFCCRLGGTLQRLRYFYIGTKRNILLKTTLKIYGEIILLALLLYVYAKIWIFFFSNWITYMNTCWEDISVSFVALFFSVLQITLFYLIMVTDSFILFNSYGQGLPWTASSTSVSFKNWNYCLTFFHAEESSVNCAELSGCIKEMKMRNKRDASLWNRKLFFRINYSEIHMSWCMERLLTDW